MRLHTSSTRAVIRCRAIRVERIPGANMVARTVRTTIALPVDLMEAADQAVRSGKARSRNDLVVAALRRELAAQERAAIDAAFAEMAHDQEYLAEASAMAEEFVVDEWEAFRDAEQRA
jgi:Arc/MetJ-type ribon-helix-helix transcriptional regulator